MALSEPLDLLTGFPGWSTDFYLQARQEQSRHASGRTRVKDFGTPIWKATWQSRSLSRPELDRWRARIEQAMISQMTFKAWQSSRCRPMAHQGASTLPEGLLHTIGSDNKTIRVEDLVGINLSVGDMLQIGSANLHRVLEPASSDPTGLFTITPHLWPGTATGQTVKIAKPFCLMTVDPGSLSASANPGTGRGAISFSATEAR